MSDFFHHPVVCTGQNSPSLFFDWAAVDRHDLREMAVYLETWRESWISSPSRLDSGREKRTLASRGSGDRGITFYESGLDDG